MSYTGVKHRKVEGRVRINVAIVTVSFLLIPIDVMIAGAWLLLPVVSLL